MSPKYDTTIDLNITSESDPISVDNTDNLLFLTRATIDTDKPSIQPVIVSLY